MNCPDCGGTSRVLGTNQVVGRETVVLPSSGDVTRRSRRVRRNECLSCGYRWYSLVTEREIDSSEIHWLQKTGKGRSRMQIRGGGRGPSAASPEAQP
jgi:hypothetical protein